MTSDQIRLKVPGFAGSILHSLWHGIADFVTEVGLVTHFFGASVRGLFAKPYRFSEIVAQMEFIGNKSVFIISLTGLFAGMALAYQIYIGFSLFNATNLTGPTVALSVTRELGPVLTGLIVAARAGGAMAARLGTMRVTEQIDALEVMGVDSIQYLVAPRVLAAILCMPLLTGIFDFVSIMGAHWLCTGLLGLDSAIFWSKIGQWMDPIHINEGLIKAAVFGLCFSVICCYRGFFTTGGARGVGEATNRGVVISMVLIIVSDYYLAHMIRIYYRLSGLI